MGRLRDLPIWSKLGLIMIVPIIATIVVGTNGLVNNIGEANDADRARTLSGLSAQASALVHELQSERANAALLLGVLTVQGGDVEARAAFERQIQKTEDASKEYRLTRSGLADPPEDFRKQLASIDTQLLDLPGMRKQISEGGKEILASTVVSRYRTLIDDLLSIRDSAAELSNNPTLGADMRAAAAISEMKEQVSLERVVVLRVLTTKAFTPQLRKEFDAALNGQEQAEEQFRVVSEPWHRDLFDKKIAGSDLREAAKFEGQLTPLTTEALPGDIFTVAAWDNAMVNKTNLLRGIETEFDEHNIEDATAHRNDLQRQVLVTAGALLGMLLLAILFAWLVARSMARSLRELRHGALTVAQYGLPQAVQRLRDPALANQMSPHQLALQIAEPLPVRSRDEFGQVAEAFNAVHLEAVRTAAEQAALRASVATMFVNLARRSQILVDRLIGHLDRLERGEEDPDRLAELFQLDHLATRMRRNDENLLVLAGADSTRIQREPAPLMDVLRAAQSEVEHYTRIEFGMIDRDIEIAAHAVNDMVHLVAELLDNATAFSPPDSAVIVEARRVGDRAVLLVEDHGIGVSPEQLNELNERLANPPMVDVAVSRMMGLVVVARLAARHGVKVELRAARERGTIADMTLPAGVLVPRALSGRANAGMPTAGMPAVGPNDVVQARPIPSTPAPRSPLASPLALESGPVPAGTGGNGGGPRFGTLTSSGLFGAGPHTGERPTVNGFANGAPPRREIPPAANGQPPYGGPSAFNDGGGGFGKGSSGPAPRDGFGGHGPGPRDAGPRDAGPGPRDAGPGPRDGGFAGRPPAGAGPARSLPAWSDLTGVSGNDDRGRQTPGDLNPLPQRRANENWTVEGEVAEDEVSGQIPRQRPEAPGPRAYDAPAAYAAGGPPPAAAAPPAWPPVSGQPGEAQPDRYAAAASQQAQAQAEAYPPVDMTAEIPRVRLDWDPAASDSDAGDSRQRFVDETMELPIFRELESAWFQTTSKRPTFDDEPVAAAPPAPAAAPAPASNGASTRPVEVTYSDTAYVPPQRFETRVPGETSRGSADRTSGGSAVNWQTAADEGWQAAAALAEAQEFAMTDTGLPKRVPQAQLVPGGVEKNPATVHRRTPESVRGLLSAYHRGVQRGRTRSDDSKTPEPTSAGPQNSQVGKEQEA
ncbi:sensor histidine kinase [Dactylosporangium aurantiacum]|uniref:sensor histidine kinase n=1 Tax=Dactylosporangium aurantiacum TaxID=35754 RepID=UPI000A5CEBD6|nr:nitrate- and nitrite sensing domain-containing protein [Dactylosporangium aurantiacum]MDG6109380.1 nitrate- and nitrite sensing domain-containing protein [Dactylosporangium aurantiacum]